MRRRLTSHVMIGLFVDIARVILSTRHERSVVIVMTILGHGFARRLLMLLGRMRFVEATLAALAMQPCEVHTDGFPIALRTRTALTLLPPLGGPVQLGSTVIRRLAQGAN